MNSETVRKITLEIDENQFLLLSTALVDARLANPEWANRSDVKELRLLMSSKLKEIM